MARGGCGLTQLRAVALDAAAAGGDALIDGIRGVAGYHADTGEGHIQFFGDDLREGGFGARAEFHFAGEHGDGLVLRDGEPGIELHRVEFGGLCAWGASGGLRG